MGIGLSTINTGEGAGSGGSVQQYVVGSTSMGATSTGVVFIGINATTARAIKVDSSGVVAVSGGGGGVQYSVGATDMEATGTGTMFIGIQSGATTGRAMLVTTTGSPMITFVGTPAVTAANVTIASITTGTMSVIPIAGTSTLGGVISIPHQSKFQGFVVATTSAATGAIIVTSGGHTLNITDLIVSVNTAMNVQLCSETTAFGITYFATAGGMCKRFINPIACTSAQSFRVIPSVSGSAAITVVGYTVT